MAVTLRLQRHGGTHRPFYHLVAADSRCPRDGKFIEKLGYYDPASEPSTVVLKADRVQYWYERGAKVSETAAHLIKSQNIPLARAKKAATGKKA